MTCLAGRHPITTGIRLLMKHNENANSSSETAMGEREVPNEKVYPLV